MMLERNDSGHQQHRLRPNEQRKHEATVRAERPDNRDLDPTAGDLGSHITKKDAQQTDHPERWERLRKYDEGTLTWKGDDERGEHFESRYSGEGWTTDLDDDLYFKVHRTATLSQSLGVPSAVENEARTLVASLMGDGEGRGHRVEKQAVGALVVVSDRHTALKIGRLHADSAEIERIQAALKRADGPAERFRVLNNLGAVTDDGRVQRALRGRLAERDDVKGVAERYGFEVRHAVANIPWGGA